MKENVLYHHGIKGQKWGVRRYQNEDGTLTDAGRKRQDTHMSLKNQIRTNKLNKAINKAENVRKQFVEEMDSNKPRASTYIKLYKSDKSLEKLLKNYDGFKTIKDIKKEITPETQEYVETLLKARKMYLNPEVNY